MYRPLGEAAPGRPLPVNEEVRVLHVADDSHMAAMYRLGLELAGFSVTAARDADRALEALERDSFDLLLLDIQLPGTSGLDLLLTLRRMAAIQAVPAVI